eukprot:SAG31_NODE_1064_length_10098_cov_3.617462_7_plen_215_part_00
MVDHLEVLNNWAPALLFFSAFSFLNFILLSLFIAVILENFEVAEAEKLKLQMEQADNQAQKELDKRRKPKVTFAHRIVWLLRGEGHKTGSLCTYAEPPNVDPDNGQFLPGTKWYSDNKSFFVFDEDSSFRRLMLRIALDEESRSSKDINKTNEPNPIFDKIVLAAILLSTVLLAIEGPEGSLDAEILDQFAHINLILYVVFMFEFFVKIFAVSH